MDADDGLCEELADYARDRVKERIEALKSRIVQVERERWQLVTEVKRLMVYKDAKDRLIRHEECPSFDADVMIWVG